MRSLDRYCTAPQAKPALLKTFHAPEYIAALKRAEDTQKISEHDQKRYQLGTVSNPVFKGMFARPATSVGSSLLAAELVANGGVAYAMGGGLHHGLTDRANGFCFLNDLVFAILRLRSLGVERIAYVDLDAHHCDGVQAAFSGDRDLLMISTHEAKRWPFTGGLSENIIDQQMNIPLLKNCNNEEFCLFMEDCVFPALARFAPEAIIIQGGADAVCDDPLSRLGLSNYTLWNAVKRLKEMCDKIILTGGGGYNPWTVARLWAGFWLVLNDRSPFIELPSGAQRGLESLSWQRKLRPSRDLITQLYDTPPEKAQIIRPETAALAKHIRNLHAL